MKKKLIKLLDDTPEAYYWMGFLMADGCFHYNRLLIALAFQDENLLIKFLNFLSCDNNIHSDNIKTVLTIMDTYSVPLLRQKFDINKRKTYNPPKNILWMEDDLLYSFIIGFIDGDGSILKQYRREDPILRIKIHSNWLNILNDITKFISDKAKVPVVLARINNQGYANVNLANHVLLKSIKNKVLELGLPYLKRKWSLIDINKINKMEKSKTLKSNIKKLLKTGLSVNEISNKLNVKYITIYQAIKRNNLNYL